MGCARCCGHRRLYFRSTGNVTWLAEAAWPLVHGTCEFFASRVVTTAQGQYTLTAVMPPDESAGVVNSRCLQLGPR